MIILQAEDDVAHHVRPGRRQLVEDTFHSSLVLVRCLS
jgi:hypothetical protein